MAHAAGERDTRHSLVHVRGADKHRVGLAEGSVDESMHTGQVTGSCMHGCSAGRVQPVMGAWRGTWAGQEGMGCMHRVVQGMQGAGGPCSTDWRGEGVREWMQACVEAGECGHRWGGTARMAGAWEGRVAGWSAAGQAQAAPHSTWH